MILDGDVAELTLGLIEIPSVSRQEGAIADAVYEYLGGLSHLEIHRIDDNVIARQPHPGAARVLLAGHLDTVPGALVSGRSGELITGRGAVDMKGGVAVMCALARRRWPVDLTYIWYACEEVDASENGLHRIVEREPALLAVDRGVVLEPSNGVVELGCQGTLRVAVSMRGRRAHAARPWTGVNAIERVGRVIERCSELERREVELAGVVFRESISLVGVEGFVANNVVPDLATLRINYRFAPDRTGEQATQWLRDQLASVCTPADSIEVEDVVDGALPTQVGFSALIEATGQPQAKLGWTDVGYLGAHGVGAVNFGPGDSLLAHGPDEVVSVDALQSCEAALARWLESGAL
ncbi:MAG: succinyl-diaminopimelate desuccinylase [Ferrimicrobium sp.]